MYWDVQPEDWILGPLLSLPSGVDWSKSLTLISSEPLFPLLAVFPKAVPPQFSTLPAGPGLPQRQFWAQSTELSRKGPETSANQ
jgi:hypothetical protein